MRLRPNEWRSLLGRIVADPRYKANLDWGSPRKGHPEATIRAHVEELEMNLSALSPELSDDEYWKLAIVIHVHDTFKRESHERRPGRHAPSITDPDSHASLARAFLAEFTDDWSMLATVQFHDEPFAIWRKVTKSEHPERTNAQVRLTKLIDAIPDWDLFIAFVIIDGTTAGKALAAQQSGLDHVTEPREWFFDQIAGRVTTRWSKETVQMVESHRT
jgi:hypothetical protein